MTLKKYISGQMGPVKQVNFDSSGNIDYSAVTHH